jgi:ATP-dependent Clp protease ATP-binding subunit ClpA
MPERADNAQPMGFFTWFDVPARLALYRAGMLARSCSQEIDPVHIALGVLMDPETMLAHGLKELGVDRELLKADLRNLLPEVRGSISLLGNSEPLLTDQTKRLLAMASKTSEAMRHGGVGPGHMLIAVVTSAPGSAAEILQAHGLTAERLSKVIPAVTKLGVIKSKWSYRWRDRLRRMRKK